MYPNDIIEVSCVINKEIISFQGPIICRVGYANSSNVFVLYWYNLFQLAEIVLFGLWYWFSCSRADRFMHGTSALTLNRWPSVPVSDRQVEEEQDESKNKR